MKVSDFIMQYLYDKGIRHIYGVSGGGIMHLCDSLVRSQIEFVPTMSEYGAGYMALADAHYRLTPAVCLVTTGPGSTNAMTACSTAYVEGLPVLFIAGQVDTKWQAHAERTKGGQEVKAMTMVRGITKYCLSLQNYRKEFYKDCLDYCWEAMTTPRWGSAWLEVALDIQGDNYV